MASTLSDQALALAMGTASVFLFDRGHPHNGAHMALASVDRDESPQQGERIDPISLHSAGAASMITVAAWCEVGSSANACFARSNAATGFPSKSSAMVWKARAFGHPGSAS